MDQPPGIKPPNDVDRPLYAALGRLTGAPRRRPSARRRRAIRRCCRRPAFMYSNDEKRIPLLKQPVCPSSSH
ncbi:hypothetical protein [Noviherbaspirillum humi]|uniref:hypothetical protein n=1 Tax=Noviherbaspirillum humi TaxID=1688639 RepID=UPI000B782CF7|nr:hypothetical protein [Noviherbaspirillum humi]